MPSVKQITCVESRREARNRNKDDINYKDISSGDEEESQTGLVLNEEKALGKSKRITSKAIEKSKKVRTVLIQNKAVNSNLNLLTQYKNRKKYCDRELFIIDKESGSKNKEKQKFVYLAFRTGLFEAMKKNMVRVMEEEFGVSLIQDPKMETYGKSKAEERALMDLKFLHCSIEYEVKIHVYNTKCSIGVDSKTTETEIENSSIAEFFVKSVISKTVDILTSKLNIEEINKQCWKLSILVKDSTHVTNAQRLFQMRNI